MVEETRTPSSVCCGLKLISTGNSVPSLRKPYSSRPAPMGRTCVCSMYFERFAMIGPEALGNENFHGLA
jgi:hypothetical protein